MFRMPFRPLAPVFLGIVLAASAPAPETPPLEPGKPYERTIAAGESHAWRAGVTAGNPVLVRVEQHGVDVVVEVSAPDGMRTAVDGPFDRQGTESLLVEPKEGGVWRIEVRARESGAPPGRYEILLEAPSGEERLAAQRAVTRAGQLYAEGSGEARRQAAEMWGEARERWRDAGDRREEARALYAEAVLLRLTGAAREALPLAREVLPLGKGMKDVQLLVLNAAGGLAGIGEVGEICVRSPHLARGYLGDERLTRERFPANPFTGRERDRLYRTGDLGRYSPDGSVTFVARADQQVKIRGFRIELGEIEAQICRFPAVREAIVLAREDTPGDRRLAAYVVPDPAAGPAPAVAELRSFLKGRLPGYMVPASFVLLERLPVTPNGKVDRKALLRIDDRQRETDVNSIAPQTGTELAIAAILQEVLRVEQVGVDDNFFDLGGNSLLLVQVHSRLQELFGREILLVEIFNNPTVRALATHLGGTGASTPTPEPSGDRTEQLRQGRERLRRRLQQQKKA